MEMKIRQCYRATRLGVAQGAPITVLHIGEEQTAMVTGTMTEADAVHALFVGSKRTAVDFFKHDVPTPIELEHAIMTVEDEIARLRAIGVPASRLFTYDAGIREIALIAGVAEQPELNLTLDAVERTFEQLTAVALGKPVASAGIPLIAAFAATLLILREFMHHLQFASITVTA